jgi:ferredoxin-NADP reductase
MLTDSPAIDLVCTTVRKESATVRTFTFSPQKRGTFPHYLAGQFITLELEIEGKPVRRCYTLSSTPKGHASQDELTITVKAKDGGLVSNWLHQNVLPGVKVRALPPAGKFHVSEAAKPKKYAFFAGGVGITPVLSMVRWLTSNSAPLDIVFIQCASRASEFLFVDELQGYASIQGFQLQLQPSSHHQWPGKHGRLTVEDIQESIPDLHERDVFCCGPDGFMAHVQAITHARGLPNSQYHQESFEVETHHYAVIDESAKSEHYTIKLNPDGQTLSCRGDQTLLDATREAGVYVPYSCEAGICGSCKIRLIEGQVAGQHEGGLEDHEAEQGWTLACCYRPVTNLTLEL